jgi:[acyl-carrier-protein] S-malonyltransferase
MSTHQKVAFIFPGQGAQYLGMGKDFVENFSIARDTFAEADEILKRSLSKIIAEGPTDVLTETRNSQVAIYVTSIAIFRVIQELFPNLKPHFTSGLSLGEYTALTVSGRTTFKDCLSLVQYRGQYMNDACQKIPGTMAVVLGLDADVVDACVKEVNLPHDLWVANFNCPGQVVISGTLKGIEAGTAAVKAKGVRRVLPLQVHGAFHSGLMAEAEKQLAPHIASLPLQDSKIEFIMNVTGNSVKDLEQIRTCLVKQVTSPVRWEQGVRYMESAGADLYVEMGCGETLAGFNKRIAVAAPTVSIENLRGLQDLEQILK